MVTGVGAWLNKVVGGWVARQREREREGPVVGRRPSPWRAQQNSHHTQRKASEREKEMAGGWSRERERERERAQGTT